MPKSNGVPRLDQVDDAEARERLGEALDQRSRERRRSGRARLRGDAMSATSPSSGDLDEHLGVVLPEAQRRHDRAAADAANGRSRNFPSPPATRSNMAIRSADGRGRRAQSERLARAGERRVRDVDVVHVAPPRSAPSR